VAFTGRLGSFALDAAFRVPATGVTGLFGPSGCGKTSVLRAIAGLLHLPGSRCAVAGDVWQDAGRFVPVHQRPIGYVFQEASLFPHLSVRGNLMFGVPRAGALRIGLDETVELLGLEALLDRAPHNLSGGERQRVAIGRALLSQPRLLLMDEPLSALDRATKEGILPFLERLHTRLGLPVLYVSHDMAEVERLTDHLVLMEGGRVRAVGPLADLQSDPALPLAVSRDAAVNLDARVEGFSPVEGLLTLAVQGGRFLVPGSGGTAGERRRLRIFAGDVSLAPELPGASTILNTLRARILSLTPVGHHEVLVVLELGMAGAGDRLLARISRRSLNALQLREGMDIHAQVKGVALAPG
jgi:molybdate transport system ATP-binding protein